MYQQCNFLSTDALMNSFGLLCSALLFVAIVCTHGKCSTLRCDEMNKILLFFIRDFEFESLNEINLPAIKDHVYPCSVLKFPKVHSLF